MKESQHSPLPSRIASLVHAHFDALPVRSKPTVHPDGSREWIPLTGIVIVRGENTPSEKLTCVAIATGAKCLPASQIPNCKGLVLHDSHAEILALRAFNYWLLNECHGVFACEQQTRSPPSPDISHSKQTTSPYVRRRNQGRRSGSGPPFEIQPDIKVYMYGTCAPCGDASMELCMASQEDATPWEMTPRQDQDKQESSIASTPSSDQLLKGRGHFSLLGIVRRKPARGDAESTLSKSCSDKLALRQVSSLLSYETSLLVAPTENAYLAGLILPEKEISRVGCERCFGKTGRMRNLRGRVWRGPDDEERDGFRFRPFDVLSVPSEQVEALWPFAKPDPSTSLPPTDSDSQPPKSSSKRSKPGTVSAVWAVGPSLSVPSNSLIDDNGRKFLPSLCKSPTGLFETIVNGVKQGNRALTPLARGASRLSRAKMWGLLRDILKPVTVEDELREAMHDSDSLLLLLPLANLVSAETYNEFKHPRLDVESVKWRQAAIRDAKEALQGWSPNIGDEAWGLEVLIDPKKRKR
ncbi:hypothetical protein ASPZODRAFT_151108 [Penicilliopsis zonata CBS 506.65]|uniref:A to I editase domain-containing protein n=1 Tax=Penicilliopsis zonata CBS 506.65 TaxID=1073090 RepID=A0A1L9SKE0_9EURO|nr:hypothetical protein ASPZODRAFT_151108 [Penicilliopsis zonata CBS 506.65]OJJ47635.1 hypothetical protein ASPZODRAFT_151108 [Penicilliopsis zonata CBS 506.65]